MMQQNNPMPGNEPAPPFQPTSDNMQSNIANQGMSSDMQQPKKSGGKKLILFVILLLGLGAVALGAYLLMDGRESNNDSNNNNQNTLPTPTVEVKSSYISQFNTEAEQGDEELIFYANKGEKQTELQAKIYGIASNKVLAEKSFALPEPIKDEFIGNSTTLNYETGDVYVSTVVPQPSDDIDPCLSTRFVGIGCESFLYKLNMKNDNQEKIYEADNIFIWKLSADQKTIVVVEVTSETSAVVNTVDVETGTVKEVASFTDLTESFTIKDFISSPLLISDDNSSIYVVMEKRNLGNTTGWKMAIRNVDLTSGSYTDTDVVGVDGNATSYLAFSNSGEKAAISYSQSGTTKLVIYDLVKNTSSEVAGYSSDNATLIWSGDRELMWKDKDNKSLVIYDTLNKSQVKVALTETGYTALPVAITDSRNWIMYEAKCAQATCNPEDKHYLYDRQEQKKTDLGEDFAFDSYSSGILTTAGVQVITIGE